MYGLDSDQKSKLTQLELSPPKVKVYETLPFSEEVKPLKEVSNDIYNDIEEKQAHYAFFFVNTFNMVVNNLGRLSTRNVRIGHRFLPKFYNCFPTNPKIEGNEMIFPMLISKEQITISYLDFQPLDPNIILYIKSDERFANKINVAPTRIPPNWQRIIMWILLFFGSWAFLYVMIKIIICLLPFLGKCLNS